MKCALSTSKGKDVLPSQDPGISETLGTQTKCAGHLEVTVFVCWLSLWLLFNKQQKSARFPVPFRKAPEPHTLIWILKSLTNKTSFLWMMSTSVLSWRCHWPVVACMAAAASECFCGWAQKKHYLWSFLKYSILEELSFQMEILQWNSHFRILGPLMDDVLFSGNQCKVCNFLITPRSLIVTTSFSATLNIFKLLSFSNYIVSLGKAVTSNHATTWLIS